MLASFFFLLLPDHKAQSNIFSAYNTHFALWKSLSRVQLCNPMDYSLQGSSVHGILQVRILELVAIPFSRGSSQPKDRTQFSHTADRFFTIWILHHLSHQGSPKKHTLADQWLVLGPQWWKDRITATRPPGPFAIEQQNILRVDPKRL